MRDAPLALMTAKSYRELVCWQLSATLRSEVNAVLAGSWPRIDRRLREDCASAARSAASNISEGFGRSDSVFARHLDIALGSLQETENHLDELFEGDFLTEAQHLELRQLAKRASVATGRLLRYLDPGRGRRSSCRLERKRSVRPARPEQT